MTINKFDPVWAESGNITDAELTDDKIENGWVGGDRPTINKFNFLQNRVETTLNEVVDRVKTTYDGSTVAETSHMIASGLYDQSWFRQSSDLNRIQTTGSYSKIVSYFNSSGKVYLIAFDSTNDYFDMIDVETMTVVDTSDPVTDDLPSGSSEVWSILDLCSDGTYIYGLFRDSNPNPDEYRIQSWNVADWSVKSGWAATGVDAGSGNYAGYANSKIIVANDDYICNSAGWLSVTSSSSAVINVRNKSDGAVKTNGSGAGDSSTGITAYVNDICSDGTNIFFATTGSGPVTDICSATIADVTTGTGGTGYPRTVSSVSGDFLLMLSCGEMIVSFLLQTTASRVATDNVIFTHDSSTATLDTIERGQNSASSAINGDATHFGKPARAIFDGLNIWILHDIYNTSSGFTAALVKIDASKLANTTTNITRQVCDLTNSVFTFNYSGDLTTASEVVFDGRDVWTNASDGSGNELYRLPMAIFRS